MKRIAILLAVGALGWLMSLPEDMPYAQLNQYQNARQTGEVIKVGGACEKDRCLVVYVAPWCPACKSLTPMINNLVSELDRDGISATVVIGKDSMNNVLEYSKRYKGAILADANGRYFKDIGAKGVPYFAVSDGNGKRLAEMSGGYKDVQQMRAQLDI